MTSVHTYIENEFYNPINILVLGKTKKCALVLLTGKAVQRICHAHMTVCHFFC